MPSSSDKSCFLFKPDGIGDFFLATGVIRLLGREFGEQNLKIAVLPVMEPVVRGQFPRAEVISLPLKTKRIVLNLFAANCLRCFFPWLTLLRTRVDISISLRYMRDYLQNFLFYSVRSPNRMTCSNVLLGNGRPVRRWTEQAFSFIFRSRIIPYPKSVSGIPNELEAHRLLASAALGRNVAVREIWPELKAVAKAPLDTPYWVCAPFSSSVEKDFPLDRFASLFAGLSVSGKLSFLVLTGSRDQLDRLRKFNELLDAAGMEPGSRTRIIIPENLQNFIDLLAGAECVVTVDTAAAHAATALDCRTLVLFSGKHPGMFAPWVRSSRQHWLLPKSLSAHELWHDGHSDNEIEQILHSLQAA
jgi:ADP-heptose:LPS heptosyltransferase